MVFFLIFIQIPLYSFQFGTLNLGKEIGSKTIREWKQKISSSTTNQSQPKLNDSRLVWISEKMEGWLYWSSVAISTQTNTLYIGTSGIDNSPSGAEYTNAVYAINISDGKIKWRYDIDEDHVVKGPIVIGPDETLYFITVDMPYYDAGESNLKTHLYALNSDGTLKWKKLNISPTRPKFWGTTSPAVDSDGTLYIQVCISTAIPPTYALIALNSDSTEKWRFEFTGIEGVVWPTPTICQDRIYFNSCNGLYAISKSTGGVLWHILSSPQNTTAPIIGSDGTIYACSERFLYAYSSTGIVKWVFDAKAMVLASPVIAEDGTIYLGTTVKGKADLNDGKIAGYFWAIDSSTGGAKWMYNIDQYMYDEHDNKWKDSDIYAPAVVGKDGTIYFTTEYRYIFALNPDGTLKEYYDLGNFVSDWPGGTVTYSALVIDEKGILYKPDSNSINGKNQGVIFAIQTQSKGLANSFWPKGYYNYRNTNYIEYPTITLTKIYDSGSHDVAIGIVSDNSGNFYITGQTGNDTNWDCLTIKYNSSGDIVWKKVYDSGKNDLGYAITVDDNANIYVAGQIFNGKDYDYLVIKYDSSGNQVWLKTFDWGGLDGAYAIGVDYQKNVYVVGQSSTSPNELNYLILKLDPDGYKLWQSTYPKSNQAYDSYGVAIDKLPDNTVNVYLSGYSNNDFLVIKYDASTGQKQWVKKYNAGVVDFGQGITVDSQHNFYITGNSFFFDVNKYNCYTIKCSSSGNVIWQQRYYNTNNSGGFGIVVDVSGCVYVSGSENNGKDDDFLVIKYDSNGNLMWKKIYDSGTQNKGYGITLNPYNNIYVTGYCMNTTLDCLTIKYKQ